MEIGTKIRTLYEHSDTGVICRPIKNRGESTPGPDWFIVKFDGNGGKLCIHRDMMVIRN